MTVFKKYRFLLFRNIFNVLPLKILSFCLPLVNLLSLTTYKLKAVRLSWLDLDTDHIIVTMSPSIISISYCPNYTHKKSNNCPISIPAIQAYHFTNTIVNIDSSSFWVNNASLVIERIPYIDLSLCNYSSGYLLMHDEKKALIKESKNNISLETGIFLGGNGSWNYYHWMIEILPKLQFLVQLPRELNRYSILLSEEVQNIPTFLESLQAFNIHHSIIYLKKQQNYQINNLIYISAVNNLVFNVKNSTIVDASFSFVRPTSLLYLKNIFYSHHHHLAPPSSINKIFLARKNIHRSYNQDEVFEVLRPYGFIEIYMEDHTLFEQIQLFKNAHFIVGPTGAAWTNIIFCSSLAKCLCWMAEEAHDFSGFSNLATYSNVTLDYITFKASVEQTKLHSATYTVEVKLIEIWLQSNSSQLITK